MRPGRGKTDLLIVGAGPAGSTLAALTARAGAHVTLVERAAFPRGTVCGEFVSAEGCSVLRRLRLIDRLRAEGAPAMRGCRVTDLHGRGFEAGLPNLQSFGREALGISRERLDDALLQRAATEGTTVRRRTEAVEPLLTDGRVTGYRLRPVGENVTEELRASLVVAADGRRSQLARRFHPQLCDPQRTRSGSWFGLKVHLRAEADRLAGNVELHLFDTGYAGLGAIEGGRINLCLLLTVETLRACGGRPERVLAERVLLNPAARERIGDARPVGRWHSVGPLRWGVRRATAGGALFVGDAAGTVDPFCGEGISNALRGAELALPHVLTALAEGRLESRVAAEYERSWREAFGPATRRVRRLGRLLERRRLAGPVLGLLGGAARGWAPHLVAATRSGRRA